MPISNVGHTHTYSKLCRFTFYLMLHTWVPTVYDEVRVYMHVCMISLCLWLCLHVCCMFLIRDALMWDMCRGASAAKWPRSSRCYMSLTHTTWSIHSGTGGRPLFPRPELSWRDWTTELSVKAENSKRRVLGWPLPQRRYRRIGFLDWHQRHGNHDPVTSQNTVGP